ncbi:MAG: 5'/3'-nucleotidase SurE [Acidobacteriota bacterium]
MIPANRWISSLLVLHLLATLCNAGPLAQTAEAQSTEAKSTWPRRVLITNDNGIEDPKIQALARAFSQVAETWVVAANQDRSGTSNLMPSIRAGRVEVQRRNLGDRINAYALDGYPADCVLFAFAGPLRDRLPDLVVSGINGGENLGDDWFGSGTIGAARTAAYFGVPALAVSGLRTSDTEAVRTSVDWVVRLAQSAITRSLQPPQYLTVSLPRVPPSKITGIEVVERARGLFGGRAVLAEEGDEGRETWKFELTFDPGAAPEASDVAAVLARSAIAVVPMRADEMDAKALADLRTKRSQLPAWSFDPAASTAPRCPSGLGIVFDDAEDETGREWGVLIAEILEGGKAEAFDLRAGDVITKLNGTGLEVPRFSAEDPDDLFARLIQELDCGDELRLEVVRDGTTRDVSYRLEERPSGPQ